MRNRIDRSVFETDLEVLQTEIRRMTRSEPVVQINNGDDDEELFESQIKDARGFLFKIKALKTDLIIFRQSLGLTPV